MIVSGGTPRTEPPAPCATHGAAPLRECDECRDWAESVTVCACVAGGWRPDVATLTAAEELLGYYDGTLAAALDAEAAAELVAVYGGPAEDYDYLPRPSSGSAERDARSTPESTG